MSILEEIHIVQLDILGLTEEFRLLIGYIICMIILIPIMSVLIRFLSHRQYISVLSYIVTTFMFTAILAYFTISAKESAILIIGLQAMAIYGVCFAIFLIYRTIKNVYG